MYNGTPRTSIYPLSLHDALPIYLRGRCTAPRRIAKDKCVIKLDLLDQIACLFVISFYLPGESYNDVGCDCDTVARLPDPSDKIDIFFRGIGAVHRLENFVGARLQRQMNVLRQLRQTRDRVD